MFTEIGSAGSVLPGCMFHNHFFLVVMCQFQWRIAPAVQELRDLILVRRSGAEAWQPLHVFMEGMRLSLWALQRSWTWLKQGRHAWTPFHSKRFRLLGTVLLVSGKARCRLDLLTPLNQLNTAVRYFKSFSWKIILYCEHIWCQTISGCHRAWS